MHRSGFINIIGAANVGKSTLMNLLVGESLSVITHKPQTTRHRILGIVNGDDYQMIFSDSPGIMIDPAYELQESMNKFAYSSFEDADMMLFIQDGTLEFFLPENLEKRLKNAPFPKFLIINKKDIVDEEKMQEWQKLEYKNWFDEIFYISALNNDGVPELLEHISNVLPEGPEYYPKDQLTDKSERFFVSEIVRKSILELYHQEIPYATEVIITEFKERVKNDKRLVMIRAEIILERKSQKQIVIGKNGSSIKQLGIESRKEIEKFLDTQVFLELYVKVKENWRDDKKNLSRFGYQ